MKPDDSYPLRLKVRRVLSARRQNPSLLGGESLRFSSILVPQAEVTSRTGVTVALLLFFVACQGATWTGGSRGLVGETVLTSVRPLLS